MAQDQEPSDASTGWIVAIGASGSQGHAIRYDGPIDLVGSAPMIAAEIARRVAAPF